MKLTYKEKIKFGKVLKKTNKTLISITDHDSVSQEWKLDSDDLDNIEFIKFIKAEDKYKVENKSKPSSISFDAMLFKWKFLGFDYGTFALYDNRNHFMFGKKTGGFIKVGIVKSLLVKVPKIEWAEALLDHNATALWIRKIGYEKYLDEVYTGPTEDAVYEGQMKMKRMGRKK